MSRTSEIARLRAEHAALATLSRFLTAMVAASHPPLATELAAARGMLRDTLVRHLKCEDWALYPRLKVQGDSDLVGLAKAFVDDMGHIAADFAAYDARWTTAAVEARWPDFRAETMDMLNGLAARIEREERDIYPAAERLAAADPDPMGRAGRRA